MENKRRIEVTRLSLIDVAFEDDCLISSPSGDELNLRSSGLLENWNVHGCVELCEADSGREGEGATNIREHIEHPTILTEPLEPTRATRVGKCNLRKSLAWDSAFFTSEGVLDPEELAVVNKTFKKAEIHALPGIQEDVRKSVESSSTLDSESLELQSLNVDLFGQAEASIQKSGDQHAKAFGTTYACAKAGSKAEDAPNLSSSANLEIVAHERMRSVTASKGCNTSKQMSEKNSKEPLCRGVAAVKSGDRKSLMPPKNLSWTNSHPLSVAPTKRKTIASEGVKSTSGRASSGNNGNKILATPKKPIPGDPTNFNSRLTPPRSSSGSPRSTKSPYSSCFSFERPDITSSDSIVHTTQRAMKYKPEFRNSNPSPADSDVNTLCKTLRNKLDFGMCMPLDSGMPTSKFSSGTSPASSFDSSDSSSSAPTNQRLHDSKAGIEKSNLRSSGFCQPAHADASINSSDRKSGGHCFKPSGLRLPSPKIGFFESANIPPGHNLLTLHPHSRIPSGLPQNSLGIANCAGAVKPKSSKFLPVRPITHTCNRTGLSCDSCLPPASNIRATSPAPLQQLQTPVSRVKIAENRSSSTLKVGKDLSIRIGGKTHLERTQQVAARVTGTARLASSCLNAEEHNNHTILNNKMDAVRQEEVCLKATGTSSDNVDELSNSGNACYDGNDENIAESFMGKDDISELLALISQVWEGDAGKSMDSACFVEASESKTSIPSVPNLEDNHRVTQFEDQDEGLGRLVEDLSLNINTVTELTEEKGFSLSHSAELSVCDQKVDFVQGLPNPSSPPFASPTKVEPGSSGKIHLDINYSFCKSSGLYGMKTESIGEKAMDKNSMFPFAEKDTNVLLLTVYSSPAIELGQENVISRNSYEEISKSCGNIHELNKENGFESLCSSSAVSQPAVFLH